MGNVWQASFAFVAFAGLTMAMGTPNYPAAQQLSPASSAVKTSADAIPSAVALHFAEIAVDLPMPEGTRGTGSVDLPMPEGTRGTGSVDLPMPEGTRGTGGKPS